MLLVHSYYFKTRNPFMYLWLSFWFKAPSQSKRLFVLTTLFVRLTQCQETDTARLKRLNGHFHLSRESHNLQFPALVAGKVWKNLLPIEEIYLPTTESEELYVSRLVKKIPCWLWYADSKTHHNDIRSLVKWMQHEGI